jgi:hypothetical protein
MGLTTETRTGFMDRADAVNIASRDERELGVMFYWAPSHIRDRFRDLVRSGLKGTGDYGVLGLGAYNGQGLNRVEANDNKHIAIRLSYPFKFDSGQFFEVGASAISGKYVPTVGTITGLATAPTAPDKEGSETSALDYMLCCIPNLLACILNGTGVIHLS